MLAGLLALCSALPGEPRIESASFQTWFDAALNGELRLPPSIEQRAERFRYVFVGGFANERMPGYFSQCAQELRTHGVAKSAIHFIFPSSHRSFDENCDGVKEAFLEIASHGPEPLVVIAHSRGAGDSLAFALQNADFARDHVYALFLVQGAFGGTGAADYVLGEGPPMDRQMPMRLRVMTQLLGRAERYVLSRGKHDGLAGLTRDESAEFWEQIRHKYASAIEIVGPKTFYITSQVPPKQLRFFKKAVATYLDTYYGPNDGVVALEDQSLPGLGTTLVMLDAAHTALTHRFPATHSPRRLRQALVESLLMAVGQADPAAEQEVAQSPRSADPADTVGGADPKRPRRDGNSGPVKEARRRRGRFPAD
ncbi:MAG: hypothetical protein P4L84_35325 [Isosphaeraceae bacterium]|nr:hypothetical protein [Isosphaeraceae bacterium]